MASVDPKLPDIKVGMRVEVLGTLGTVQYVGLADFAPGKWIGVVLDLPCLWPFHRKNFNFLI